MLSRPGQDIRLTLQGSVIYRAKQLKCHKKQAVLAF
jgi:hypothetical protein